MRTRGPRHAKLAPVFRGFPLEAVAFYEGLAADNSKAYFDAHRETYETCVREPLEELVHELAPTYGGAKVFRPHRDTRFSKDKSPYKLAAAAIARPSDASIGGTYVELSAAGLRVGGGAVHLERDQLANVRRAIDEDLHGRALEAAFAHARAAGLSLFDPELTTAPRGWPKDHPRIDLLRRKAFVAVAVHAPAKWLATPKAKDRVVEAWEAVRPLNAWLDRHASA